MAKRSDYLRLFTALGGKQLADEVLSYEKLSARNEQRYGKPRQPASQWRILGAVENVRQPNPQTLWLECEHGSAEIVWLASNCIRIRMSTGAQQFNQPPSSYAVDKITWPPVQVGTKIGPDAIEMQTADLICQIGRKPLRIGLQTMDGRMICIDSTGMQYRSDGAVRLAMKMHPEESSYGMGERASGLNLRGKQLALWNTDTPDYTRGSDPLYYSIPFYLGVHSGFAYGVFWDNSFRGSADLGKSTPNELTFEAEGGELRYYLFGGDMNSVLARYTELTGRIKQPPLWSLGYQHARFSDQSQDAVLQLAQNFRARGVPCDVIHLDIKTLENFRVFTWNNAGFPDVKKLVADLHRNGFKVIAYVNPGIKIDAEYATFQTGAANDVFIKYPDGERTSAVTWGGLSSFPDFMNPTAREWWGSECSSLLTIGIDGLLNDMGEPTIFTPEGSSTLPDYVTHSQDKHTSTHTENHNLYGLLMGRASVEALAKYRPNQRPFNVMRAGYAGGQRYGMVWTGENLADWDHLRMSIPMVLNMGLSGIALAGPDIGGFRGNANGELYTRWLQAACLMPFFRTRAGFSATQREPWAYGQPYEVINRLTIELRYKLIPYLYVVRPIFTDEPYNPKIRGIDDCYLLGDAMLVAPVLHEGAVSRSVYLPAGQWYDFWTNECLEGGQTVEVTAPLERLPLFVKSGAAIPMWPDMLFAGEKAVDVLTLRIYPGEAESILYEDKGEGLEYEQGQYRWIYITSRWDDDTLIINRRVAGSFEPSYKSVRMEIVGFEEEPSDVRVDRQGAPLWFFDDDVLELKVGEFKQVEVTRKSTTADKTILHRPWDKK
jgi:alpha-glucosidase